MDGPTCGIDCDGRYCAAPACPYVQAQREASDTISRTEALRISRQIIERAEQERRQMAEQEAQRGLTYPEGESNDS